MKLFVFSKTPAVVWRNQTQDGALAGAGRAPKGRLSRWTDLRGWMLILVGPIYLGQFLSLFQIPAPLEYLLAGVVLGGTAGLMVVVRREQRDGELPPEQVRHIELTCIAAGVGLMALAVLVQIVINVLTTL